MESENRDKGFISEISSANVNVDSARDSLDVPRLDRLLRLFRGQDPRTGLDVSSYPLKLRIKWYLEQELRLHPRISEMPYIRNLDLPRSGVGSLLPYMIPRTDWEAPPELQDTLCPCPRDMALLIQSSSHYEDVLKQWPRNRKRGLSIPKTDEESASFSDFVTLSLQTGKFQSGGNSWVDKFSEPIVNVDSGLQALDVPRLVRCGLVLAAVGLLFLHVDTVAKPILLVMIGFVLACPKEVLASALGGK